MGLLEIWLQKEADLNSTNQNNNKDLLEQLSEIPAPTVTEYQTTETDAGVTIPTLPSSKFIFLAFVFETICLIIQP